MNKKLAELLGIMAGDGCLSRSGNKYIIYISGHKIDDMDYHDNIIRNLFLDVFNKETKINKKRLEKTIFIRFSDKEIFNHLSKYLPIGKKYSRLNLPKEVIKNKDYFFAFIRGLIDTDGCMVLSKQHKKYPYYPRIELSSISRDFLENILLELKKYNFYGSLSHKGKKDYRLELPGIKNLARWMDYIGFNNPKHLKKIKTAV